MSARRSKTVFLETMGCQMNVLDSQLVLGALRRIGYVPTDQIGRADLVLLNTCSVRQHAEDKVYARLGRLRRSKQQRPEMIVGVIGCMAQRDPGGIRRRMPHVDLLCGPGELNRLPALIDEARRTRRPTAALQRGVDSRRTALIERTGEFDSLEALDLSRSPQTGSEGVQAYVRIQRGCDKFCTYCVVPFTRGKERSRPPQHIVAEARMLADSGVKEITLLGQTVNSYLHVDGGRPVGLARLLEMLHGIPGLERLRFVTNYPADFSDDVLRAMADLPKVCEYLHLPAQSGSNRILAAMRRNYRVEEYLRLIDRARKLVPGLALAGDFSVGFPGETERDFAATVDLVGRVGYKNCFVFKYSPRPGTAADRRLRDDVPAEVKKHRNNYLLMVQESISREQNRRLIGSRVEILVEGPSKRSDAHAGKAQLTGRTRDDRIVVLDTDADLSGQLIQVEITDATALTLFGRLPGRPGSHLPLANMQTSR